MPELPEVETVRRDLSESILGRRVLSLRVFQPEMLVGAEPGAVRDALTGARILEVDRHGKALILRFSGGWSLIVHFRMTGRLYPVPAGGELPSHTRTVFALDDGRLLLHVDPRRLGTLELIPTHHEATARTLAAMGADALKSPPTARFLASLTSRRTISVKQFLLDQTAIAGIGNIYACEILSRARIDPRTPCNCLADDDLRRLARSIRCVIRKAIHSRGTTISDYRTGTGEPGGFQHSLQVYGREGDRCLRRGCRGVVRRLVQGQRSTFYCPDCQAEHRTAETGD